MTKRHFEAFAAVVRRKREAEAAYEKVGEKALEAITRHEANGIEEAVIEVCQEFNGRFDAERFRKACQPKA